MCHAQETCCSLHIKALLVKLKTLYSECFISGNLQWKYYYSLYPLGGQGRVIANANMLQAGQIRVQILVGGNFVSKHVQTSSGVQPASTSMGTRGVKIL
jgi:hypothetical protein